MSEPEEPKQSQSKNNLRTKRLLRIGYVALGVLLLVFAASKLYHKHQITSTAPSKNQATETVTETVTEPSEADITDYPNVPADQPRKIELPSINASGYMQKVGLDKTNAVAVPTNISLAGWFVNSVKPGDIGVSLVAAHVQGQYKEGLFKNIQQLKKDDVLYVYFGDGSRTGFTVQSVNDYSVEEAAVKMLEKSEDLERQLNLITCAGTYNKETKQYEKRTIVVARANL